MNSLARILCALVAVAVTIAAPASEPVVVNELARSHNEIPILKQAVDGPNPDGSYNYNYETGNGIQAQEDGHLNNAGTDQEILEARGSYSYTDAEGNTFQVSYVANENGFQPEGAHLPEVPPQIKRALQYIAEHPEENGE
ncbi:flexible cuticle protein 12-like [Nylanderia fulva]|uniref:flexible cuticle protein 12-like n=1 Tax=Nylanderia fulva TaxID=613905 RepID=UPI0010FB8E3C|nr:flexible cuticle protein 12-like [Nylanderia fulva]XP_029162580.1 flexible cuticle protein 12-like [Nylanderia fulva]